MPTQSVSCALQELKSYLAEGVPLDELWQVAKGQKKYADFVRQRKEGDAAPPPPSEKEVQLPDDVVSHILEPTCLCLDSTFSNAPSSCCAASRAYDAGRPEGVPAVGVQRAAGGRRLQRAGARRADGRAAGRQVAAGGGAGHARGEAVAEVRSLLQSWFGESLRSQSGCIAAQGGTLVSDHA